MDFANRGNRPMQQQQQQPAPQATNEQPHMPSAPVKDKKKMSFNFSKMSAVFVLFGVALLSAVIIVGLVFGGKSDKVIKETDLIKTDQYQAVFLNSQDGQVYFGKLAVYNNDLYVLKDIYYVRVENPIQPEGTNQAASQQKISLAKLGNELHGPEDVMFVARDKVLYWENLKADGQVVKAITDYKANGDSTKTDTTKDTTTNP